MNILKGFIIGIAKIAPGISGSMLAISLGIYEKTIEIIANLKKINLEQFIFLLKIFIGILLGVCFFSNIIKYCLSRFYTSTMFLFLGLIIGSIKITTKEISYQKTKQKKLINITVFIISFSIGFILSFNLNLNIKQLGIITYFILGTIEAFSSIIPGISGTAIFMSLGYYQTIIEFFSNIFSPTNLKFTIFFALGILSTTIILSKIINYFLKHYKNTTFIGILGFMICSIITIITKIPIKTIYPSTFFTGIFLLYLGYKFIIKINNLLENTNKKHI